MTRSRHRKPKAITPKKATILVYWDGHDFCTTADDQGPSVSLCPTFRKRLSLPDLYPGDTRIEYQVTLIPIRKYIRQWVPIQTAKPKKKG